jgi:hypothetical protein
VLAVGSSRLRGFASVALGAWLALWFAGCHPKATECTYLCPKTGPCALGLTCGTDGYCHADQNLDHCVNPNTDLFAPPDLPPSDLAVPWQSCFVTQPTGQKLVDVFGAAPDDVWAVGDAGTVVHCTRPDTCTVESSGTANQLFRVWASAPDDVWAVGVETAVHCAGAGACAPMPLDALTYYTAVGGARGDVWIAGAGPGATTNVWVNCTAPGACATTPLSTSGPVIDLLYGGPSDVWLATGGWLVHCTSPSSCGTNLVGDPNFAIQGLWGLGTEVWAAGLIAGGPTGSPGMLRCSSPAAADCATFVLGWSFPAGNMVHRLNSIWGSGPGDVWSGGTFGMLTHCTAPDALDCTDQFILDYSAPAFWSVRGRAAGEVWAVGQRGKIVHCAQGTCAAPAISCITTADLNAAWVSPAGDLWAVGTGGTIVYVRAPPP